MSLKNWILHKMNGLTTRVDLPRSPVLGAGAVPSPAALRRHASRTPAAAEPRGAVPAAAHLGPYAALIKAIRDELEQFVVSYVRLHLAIAERDRYLLTSIEVRAAASDDAELLRRFVREFKPEQIKRYLAKEIIGSLPNASAIDLSQFAGLNAEHGDGDAEEEEEYEELLAELRSTKPAADAQRYDVTLVGRWSEVGSTAGRSADALRTPLAGRSAEVAIDDAGGRRRVVLQSVVAGRRYVVGKGEGCDIVVNGVYASRRHCEIWLDHGTWWVTDAGSTNGVRVERGTSVLGRSAASGASAPSEVAVIEVTPGARIVLSAHTEGSAADYPRIVLEAGGGASALATPIAPAVPAPATPSTPIVAARPPLESGLTIAVRMASGARTVELRAGELPFSVGRSRSQSLVIDRAHEGVSGHHIDITEIDDTGVTVVVHGDNGVIVAGASYPPGARLRWKPGEPMELGRIIDREPRCLLTLSKTA